MKIEHKPALPSALVMSPSLSQSISTLNTSQKSLEGNLVLEQARLLNLPSLSFSGNKGSNYNFSQNIPILNSYLCLQNNIDNIRAKINRLTLISEELASERNEINYKESILRSRQEELSIKINAFINQEIILNSLNTESFYEEYSRLLIKATELQSEKKDLNRSTEIINIKKSYLEFRMAGFYINKDLVFLEQIKLAEKIRLLESTYNQLRLNHSLHV